MRGENTATAVGKDQLGRTAGYLESAIYGDTVRVHAPPEGDAKGNAEQRADGRVRRDGAGGAAEASAVVGRQVVLQVGLADAGEVDIGVTAEEGEHDVLCQESE